MWRIGYDQNERRQETKYMATTTANVTTANSNGDYALGYTKSEHDRLIRQATRIAPYTERLFREAGIGPGQRVLDLGSGVGDVSILLARIVGSSGEVVGIERDGDSIARANARVNKAGLRNISFTQADANEIVSAQLFDADVGRFILMFLTVPASVLRSLAQLVQPGGILVFQEPTWVPLLAFAARFPGERITRTGVCTCGQEHRAELSHHSHRRPR
jgi:ubiquinone/menaquinone biosynthesis C-methylase UbiE